MHAILPYEYLQETKSADLEIDKVIMEASLNTIELKTLTYMHATLPYKHHQDAKQGDLKIDEVTTSASLWRVCHLPWKNNTS